MNSELRARVTVAGALIPVGLFVIWLGGWALGGLLGIFAALAAREFYNLAADRAARPFPWIGIAGSVLLVGLAIWNPNYSIWAPHAYMLLLLLGLTSFAAALFDRSIERALLSAAVTVSGALYTGGTLAFGLFIRALPEIQGAPLPPSFPPEGALLLMLPLCATWAGDTAAYFAGRRFGKRRLAPHISPGKTVEGAVAGLAGALGAGFALGFALDGERLYPVPPAAAATIALVLGVAGQLGDLAESRLKREAGVKDSGRILPGHGGVLDRFDGLFLTIPLAYGLIVLWAGLS